MKNYIRFLLLSLIAIFLLSGSANAINIPYWQIASANAEFELVNENTNLNFGIFTVDDFAASNPTIINQYELFQSGNFEQLLKDDWGTFGFYVYNHILDRTFFSDLTISPQYETDRFVFNALPGDNWWDILFTQNNTAEPLNTYLRVRSTDIAPAPVPEPAALFLFGIGLLGFAGITRIKKNNKFIYN